MNTLENLMATLNNVWIPSFIFISETYLDADSAKYTVCSVSLTQLLARPLNTGPRAKTFRYFAKFQTLMFD
jgi:hypothetical protein